MNKQELYERVFGEQLSIEKYKMIPHEFKGNITGKPYCIKCGLISASNDFTQWAIGKGCLNQYHPSYKSMLRKTSSVRNKGE